MAMIFQPDRVLLTKQIQKYARYVTGSVLDVGAGSISRYRELFHCDEYVRMDVVAGPNVDIVGSAEQIPFDEAHFDAIVCTQVLEHIPHPTEACREFFRVLKPGGILLLTVPQMNELHEEPADYWRYTRFGLERLFTEQGFTIVDIDQRGGFFALKAQTNIRYLIDRLHLFSNKWSWALKPFIKIYGLTMMHLDSLDRTAANRKHALGWCVVAKKPLAEKPRL